MCYTYGIGHVTDGGTPVGTVGSHHRTPPSSQAVVSEVESVRQPAGAERPVRCAKEIVLAGSIGCSWKLTHCGRSGQHPSGGAARWRLCSGSSPTVASPVSARVRAGLSWSVETLSVRSAICRWKKCVDHSNTREGPEAAALRHRGPAQNGIAATPLARLSRQVRTKSSIEVTKCTSSNILVWFGRDAPEKSVAGLRESLISSPFENLQKD